MKRFAKLLLVTLGFGALGLVTALVPQKHTLGAGPVLGASASFTASSADQCSPVHGTIHSVFATQNCTSPVGLCTVGTITGAGPLDGATSFLALLL